MSAQVIQFPARGGVVEIEEGPFEEGCLMLSLCVGCNRHRLGFAHSYEEALAAGAQLAERLGAVFPAAGRSAQ